MYKFIFIHDKDLQEELTAFVVAALRERFGFNIKESDFDDILNSCLEQIDEIFDINY